MLNLLEIQKKFRLFQLGDLVNVTVISVGETVKVKTNGGVFGVLEKHQKLGELLPGTQIEAEVKSFVEENIPVFEPTLNFLLKRKPQSAVVKFSSPRAIVVAFEINPDLIGCYEPKTMPQELLNLVPEDRVTASKITQGQDYFIIGSLEKERVVTASAEVKPNPNGNWDEEKIKEVTAKGSSKTWNKIRLGKIYMGEIFTRSEVILPGENHGFLDKGLFPKEALRVKVRVIFIDEKTKKITVELLSGEVTEPVETTQPSVKKQLADVEDPGNGIVLNQRDESVYHIGKSMGSLNKIKGCWLGFTYSAFIKDGLPDLSFFARSVKNEKPEDNYQLEIKTVIKSSVALFQDGDKVFFQIALLKFTNGTEHLSFRKAEIHVNILKVENGEAPMDLKKITLNDETVKSLKEVS